MQTDFPSIDTAVLTYRTYQNALEASTLDPESVESWIERNASPPQRNRLFPVDAGIGMLHFVNHPQYPTSSLSSNQREWSNLMADAEQVIQNEATWTYTQVTQFNQTKFMRVFDTDLSWIHDWATDLGIDTEEVSDEYLLNHLIDRLRYCQGQNGAGGIPHTTYSPPGSPDSCNDPR